MAGKVNRVLHIEQGKAEVVERPYPRVKEGFAIIKVHIAPICTEQKPFDIGFYEWYERADRLGHEGVGEIVELGPGVSGFSVGDRVIIYQGWACGTCWVCRQGLGATHCINFKGYQEIEDHNGSESGAGGFSQFRLAPVNMLQKIPDGLDYKYASAANCLIGCTYTAIQEHQIRPEHYCLVTGIGFIGCATIVNLKYRGAKVIVLGRSQGRMEMARQFGADLIVNPEDADWMDQVRAFTPDGRGPDFAFECSGYPYYQKKSIDVLRHYGTTILLGYAAQETDMTLNLHTETDLCWCHKSITASFDVAFRDRGDLLEVLQESWMQGQIDQLVTHQFPMSRATEAFETILAKKACKVHLLPQF